MTSPDPTDSYVSEPRSGQETPRRRRRLSGRLISWVLVIVVVVVLAFDGVGYQLFYRDHSDPLRKVDAIVVLGGEHDGREDYGLQLAREGYANTVLISDPYLNDGYHRGGAELMERVCSASTESIEVICFNPDPSTTRGEAMFTERMAKERHWRSVIVVSWRYHLFRARYIFGQCFAGDVVMRSVPRDYGRSIPLWTATFAYQYVGLAKAAVLGC
ncbi:MULTISPECIES: YdcF family protein [Gordonia]|uniref:YdcF family protein n=1 Tax=Gordonia jacobaea TaxID=122202 RepID=UPI003D71042E